MKRGFTLLEVTLVTTIGILVSSLMIVLLVQNSGLFTLQTTKINQGLSLNDVAYEISNNIKISSMVVSSFPPSNPSYFSSLTTLILAIPSIDLAGNTISQTNDYIIIIEDPSNPKILKEITYPDPSSSRKSSTKFLLNNLQTVNFSYLDSNNNLVTPTSATKIGFDILVTTQAGRKNQQGSVSGQVNLRNL